MKKEDIDKIIACRAAIDIHRSRDRKDAAPYAVKDAEHTKATVKMLEALKSYGFDNVSDFSRWNDEMNYAAFCECRPIKGACDRCEGYNGEPPCKMWGANACYVKPATIEQIKVYSFKAFLNNKGFFSDSGNRRAQCPDGHGWFVDMTEAQEFPFDLRWRI